MRPNPGNGRKDNAVACCHALPALETEIDGKVVPEDSGSARQSGKAIIMEKELY